MNDISLNTSIPKNMETLLLERIKEKFFTTSSEYLRHLIRKDIQNSRDTKEMNAIINKGIQSGRSKKSPQEIFAEAKKIIKVEKNAR